MEVSVICGTFGTAHWNELAERALASVPDGVPTIHVHGEDLSDARNRALAQVETEWVVHLDADDELEPGFLDAIVAGTADLRAPAVRYVRRGRALSARLPRVAGHDHDCTADCLPDGNWLVVGTAVRAELVRRVGGWHDWPIYEDWDLWLRCWLAGATVEAIPEAIYRAHARRDSRNRAPAIAFKNGVHRQIVAANLGRAAA